MIEQPKTSRIEKDGYERELSGSYSVVQRLLPRHHRIIDLHLQGLSAKDIAQETGLKKRQVLNIINSPVFQSQLSLRRSKIEDQVEETILKAQDDVLETLKKNTLSAVNRLVEISGSDNEAVARQAANDILDRGGYPKTSRQENDVSQTLILEDKQAQVIAEALKEL